MSVGLARATRMTQHRITPSPQSTPRWTLASAAQAGGVSAVRRWSMLAAMVALSGASAVVTKQLLVGGASRGAPPALTVLAAQDQADALGGAMLAAEPEWADGATTEARADGSDTGVYIGDTTVRFFDGRPVRPARRMTMVVTAYSPDERSCGDSADGITASLHHVETNAHRLVAADRRVLPLGSMVTVPGYDDGRIVPVLDVGGAIKGRRLDVLFATHEQARRWGVRRVSVTVWEYADGLPPTDWRRVRDAKRVAVREASGGR